MSYKQNNDKIILGFIRENPKCTRSHIQYKTGLSKAATAKIVNRLIEAGFIEETAAEIEKRQKGKPFKILQIAPKKSCFLGISVGLWGIHIAIMDFGLDILWEKNVSIETFNEKNFQQQYDELIKEAAKTIYFANIQKIGLALPATITKKGKIIDFALHEKQLEKLNFMDILASCFKEKSVLVTHHSIALSYFETIKNRKTSRHLFVLNLGHGIGGSFIVKGKSYIGAHSYAGNIGAFFPYSSPRPSIVDLASHLDMPVAGLTMEKMDDIYKKGDARLGDWIRFHGKALSMPLSAVVELFDPQKIILGGMFPRSILKALQGEIDLNFLEAPERISKRKAKIKVASAVGPQVYAYGVARLALKKYVNQQFA